MPDPIDIPVPNPVPPSGDAEPNPDEENEMAVDNQEIVNANCAHSLQRLNQVGTVAHENFTTIQKIVDYDYLENKRMVTLDEAIGVREVASKTVPAGPNTVPAT